MRARIRAAALLVFAASSILVCGLANAAQPDPAATRQALDALLAASNRAIPADSSCSGDYGQSGSARLRDLLAIQLANLNRGANTVTGACQKHRCEVVITHASGEDVSSLTIRFALKGDALDSTSLQCVMTP